MNENEFMALMDGLQKYLESSKTFMLNPKRLNDLQRAWQIAKDLFPDSKIEIKEDPLQMGAKILRIEGDCMTLTQPEEIPLYIELLKLVDNFEIYSISNGNIRFAAVMEKVLIKI